MRKRIYLLLSCLLVLTISVAQKTAGTRAEYAGLPGTYQGGGHRQVDEWVKQSLFYTMKTGEAKTDLDTAALFAGKALDLSRSLHYTPGFNESLVALSLATIETGNTRKVYQLIDMADDTTKIRILMKLQGYYYYGGQVTKSADSSKRCVDQALSIARSIKAPTLELQLRTSLLPVLIRAGDQASFKEHAEGIRLLENKVPHKSLISIYHITSQQLYTFGEFNHSLQFTLNALKLSEKNDGYLSENLYYMLGCAYRSLGENEKCIEAHQRSIAINRKKGDITLVWLSAEFIVHCLTVLKRNDEALHTLFAIEKEFGFSCIKDQIIYKRTLGYFYRVTGRIEDAKKTLLEMIALADKYDANDAGVFNFLGKAYYSSREFDKARFYLQKAQGLVTQGGPTDQEIHRTLFSVDTAAGDHRSAIKTLLKIHAYEESARKMEREKHTKQLLLQYETEKKDKDLQLKQQAIELLMRKNELKEMDLQRTEMELAYQTEAKERNLRLANIAAAEKDKSIQLQKQSISLLEKDALLKESAMSGAALTRNIMIAGSCLLLAFLLMLYNQYKLKQRNALELANRNRRLEVLVWEKELLVKEVHHRVKNNLHTIISLLESQAHFLSNDALTAIQKSQNRVYAMSLIHQKLYQHNNVTTVQMDAFLKELLLHLEESFSLHGSIVFETELEPVGLDISQATPLGLILNEAITNAIKYAFPGQRNGIISVSLTQGSDGFVHLHVHDNGIGLPPGWEQRVNQSLGVKLMKGLSEDIQGEFRMNSNQGTSISIRFRKAKFA